MLFDYRPLGELLADKGYIRGPFGSALKRQELKSHGVPVYEQQQAIDGHRNFRYFIDQVKYEELQRFTVRENDLIVSCSGTVGRVSVIKPTDPIGVISQALLILRPNILILEPLFLYYFLTSPEGQLSLFAASHGAVQQNIAPRAVVEKISTPLPSILEQKAIIALLKSLDDRITLLRESNKTLEAIAKAIFKSWFIEFDPVRAKIEGHAPTGIDKETAAQFPDVLVESELGMVPKGWSIASIEEICSVITNGGTPSRSSSEFWQSGSIPWYKTGDFSDGFLLEPSEKITHHALANSSVKLLPENAVLMAIYAAPTVGRLGVLTRPSTFNQACTGMVAKNDVGTWFLYWALYFARAWFNSRANGAAQQNISKAIVAAYKITKPTEQLLSAFHELADPIHKKIRGNVEQIETLLALRDTLLPKLVSGKMRLTDSVAEIDLFM